MRTAAIYGSHFMPVGNNVFSLGKIGLPVFGQFNPSSTPDEQPADPPSQASMNARFSSFRNWVHYSSVQSQLLR
jgi:hypothetical protein